jgi:hypothetical protein
MAQAAAIRLAPRRLRTAARRLESRLIGMLKNLRRDPVTIGLEAEAKILGMGPGLGWS